MKSERQYTTVYPAAYNLSWSVSQLVRKAASKSDIIYAGEENTPQILSDRNEKITRSKKEHLFAWGVGRIFKFLKNDGFIQFFAEKIKKSYEKLIILFNFQKV